MSRRSAGSVEILFRIYAKCLYGGTARLRQRLDDIYGVSTDQEARKTSALACRNQSQTPVLNRGQSDNKGDRDGRV